MQHLSDCKKVGLMGGFVLPALMVLTLSPAAAGAQSHSPRQVQGTPLTTENQTADEAVMTQPLVAAAGERVSYSVVGKAIPLSGVFADQGTAATEYLKGRIDFQAYGLDAKTADRFGDKTIVDYVQKMGDIPVEGGGISAVINNQGRLEFLKVNLYDIGEVKTVIAWDQTQAQAEVESRYASVRPEQVTFHALLLTPVDDKTLRAAYKFLVVTRVPVDAFWVYLDAESGAIIKQASAMMSVNGNIDGHFSGAWKNVGETFFSYGDFAAASYKVGYQVGEPPAMDDKMGWTYSTEQFSDDTGYYHYTQNVGAGDFFFLYYMGNDVCSTQVTYDGESFQRLSTQSATYSVNNGTTFTLDFDWTDTQLLADHPEYYADMDLIYHAKMIYMWYDSWLDADELYFTPVAARARLDCWMGGYFFPGTIGLNNDQSYDKYVIYHEMGHAVMYYSVIQHHSRAIPQFWNEGQAEYFAWSHIGIAGSDHSYYYKCNITTDVHALGSVQTGSWWQMRSSLDSGLIDSLVFFSAHYDVTTQAKAVQSFLLADDDDADLSNGTPHVNTICEAYRDHWVGPYAPLVFKVNGYYVCLHDDGRRDMVTVTPGAMTSFCLAFDTYPFDSLVWYFEDDNTTQIGTTVTHTFNQCGTFDVVCTAYYPWGSRVDTQTVQVTAKCGDADSDGDVDGDDYSFIINYLYRGGPAPMCPGAADVNGDCRINLLDVSYLIKYLYQGGPAPNCSCTTW